MNLQIVYVATSEITKYERNARRREELDVNAIAESIKAFGFNDPIAVWGEQNEIVEGHGRIEAAERLGMKKVPIIRLDHLTDEQRKAYALAHNMTHLLSKWDKDILEMELDSITEIDMKQIGFGEEKAREQKILESKEIDIEDFEEDSFEYECPNCGFRWNE